jgi:hypothetical protein
MSNAWFLIGAAVIFLTALIVGSVYFAIEAKKRKKAGKKVDYRTQAIRRKKRPYIFDHEHKILGKLYREPRKLENDRLYFEWHALGLNPTKNVHPLPDNPPTWAVMPKTDLDNRCGDDSQIIEILPREVSPEHDPRVNRYIRTIKWREWQVKNYQLRLSEMMSELLEAQDLNEAITRAERVFESMKYMQQQKPPQRTEEIVLDHKREEEEKDRKEEK